jgi:cell shape-determining protein MreC
MAERSSLSESRASDVQAPATRLDYPQVSTKPTPEVAPQAAAAPKLTIAHTTTSVALQIEEKDKELKKSKQELEEKEEELMQAKQKLLEEKDKELKKVKQELEEKD